MALGSFDLDGGLAEAVPDLPQAFPFPGPSTGDTESGLGEPALPNATREVDEDGDNPWSDIASLFDTAILYANRQIHTEAREAMLKGNKFVRICARGLDLDKILARIPVTVVVHRYHSNNKVRRFKGAVMSYLLRDEQELQEQGPGYCDMVILGRDLDAFVRGVGEPGIGGAKMASFVKHYIRIHDPFMKPGDPNCSNLGAQRRLLQPFLDHFQGFTNVKIDGKVDKNLAKKVIWGVYFEPMPDPDEFIASIRKLNDEGNAFLQEDDYSKAILRWVSASAKMQRLRFSRIWPRVKLQLGPAFVDTVAELFFNVHSNQTQALLEQIRDLLGDEYVDGGLVMEAMESLETNAYIAARATETFEATWQPTVRQSAKMRLRTAQAARLTGDPYHAQDLIIGALTSQPDDVAIREEANEIAWLVDFGREEAERLNEADTMAQEMCSNMGIYASGCECEVSMEL